MLRNITDVLHANEITYFCYPLRQLLADTECYIYRVTGAQAVNMSCTLLLLLLLLDRV